MREHPDYRLLRVASATGMRRNELLALGWGDVHLDKVPAAIGVTRSLVEVSGEFTYGPPKTKEGLRTIEVGPSTVAVLLEHRQAQDEHHERMGAGWHEEDDLVFPGVNGRPRRPAMLTYAVHGPGRGARSATRDAPLASPRA